MEKIKEHIIKDLQENIYCRIGASAIHGAGVIAIKTIPPKTNPFKCSPLFEELIPFTMDDLKDVDPVVVSYAKEFGMNKDGNLYISALGVNAMNISFYLNHSDNPNLESSDDGITFVTMREIQKGEELTIDYNKYGILLP